MTGSGKGFGFLVLAAALAGCAGAPPRGEALSEAAPALPAIEPAPGAETWTVDAARSELRILVYRAGALGGLGHNHVLGGGTVSGRIFLHEQPGLTRFTLSLPVDSLEVDRPAQRREAGPDFASEPDAEAVAGTRRNLLGARVLDAARHPRIEIRGMGLHGPQWLPRVRAVIELRGTRRALSLPVAMVHAGDRLHLIGRLRLRQSEFGIEPLSLLGGAVRVRDEIEVQFHLVAVPAARAGRLETPGPVPMSY